MKGLHQTGRVGKRLALACVLALSTTVALLILRKAPEQVRLLHVGFANHGDQGRAPVFCLTNGSTRPITYADESGAIPSFRYRVQSSSGWSGPCTNRGGFGLAPPVGVLPPGQGVTFEFGRPLSLRGWRIGLTYYFCEASTPVAATNSGTVWLASAIGRSTNSLFRTALFQSRSVPLPNFVRERRWGQRLETKLPKFAPAWFRRWLRSGNPDPVTWGPMME